MNEPLLKMKIAELEMRIEKLESILSRRTDDADYYTINEAASVLKVCPATIYNKIYDGSITAVKVGKCWRIPKSVIYNKY